MNRKNGLILTAVINTALLTTLISVSSLNITENAKVYGKEYSQSTTQANKCGDGFTASNIFCSNQGSNVQGDQNIFSFTADQNVVESTKPHRTFDSNTVDDSVSRNDVNLGGNIDNRAITPSNEDPWLLVLPCCDYMPGGNA